MVSSAVKETEKMRPGCLHRGYSSHEELAFSPQDQAWFGLQWNPQIPMLWTPGPQHQLVCSCIMLSARCACQQSCGSAGVSGKEAEERCCQCVSARNQPLLHAPQMSNGTKQRSSLRIPVNRHKTNSSVNGVVCCWAGEVQDKLMKLWLKPYSILHPSWF